MHPYFEVYQKTLKKFENFIESCTVEDGKDEEYDKAINRLKNGMEAFLHEIDHIEQRLTGNTEQECILGVKLGNRYKYLIKVANNKLIELGCDPDQMEFPEEDDPNMFDE